MDQIMICTELFWDEINNNNLHYFKVPEDWEGRIKKDDFIYLLKNEEEKRAIVIFQILNIELSINIPQESIVTDTSENEELHIVSEEFFITLVKIDLEEHYIDSNKGLKKSIDILIESLEFQMLFYRKEKLSDKRKEYLLNLFFSKDINEFYALSDRDKKNWFENFSEFEMNFIHMINLYKLKYYIYELINLNTNLQIEDKNLLKKEYYNKFDMISSSIYLKSINRYNSKKPINVDISSDGKNIILGKFTPFELNINFLSFWNIIKSLLTVSLIPVLVALLDSDKKVIIYIFLGVVYFITLILSDEKQTENVIDFMYQNGCNKTRQFGYYTLFYIGIIAVFIFIIFSLQLVFIPNIVNSFRIFLIYFIGDFLLAFTGIIILMYLIDLVIFVMTGISSTFFFMKRAKKISLIMGFILKILFWIISNCCIYYILGIGKYTNNNQTLEWEGTIYIFASLISLLKIIQNICIFKEEINAERSKRLFKNKPYDVSES